MNLTQPYIGAFETLVLVTGVPSEAPSGGTHRYFDSLQEAVEQGGMRVFRVPSMTALADGIKFGSVHLGRRSLVFCQEEGSLSASFARASRVILGTGCFVVEKNVFNLPSRWRPCHPNYTMVCTSNDGLWRWRLRGWMLRKTKQVRVDVLPNLMYRSEQELEDQRLSRKLWRTKIGEENRPLQVYRQGRPTPIKWTTFEADLIASLTGLSRKVAISAHARGVPDSLRGKYLAAGFRISPYTAERDQLQKDWNEADVYLHHSKIGESLGVSVLEAAALGVPVAFAISPFWDQGAAEYLDAKQLVGSRRKIRREFGAFALSQRGSWPMDDSLHSLDARLWQPQTHVDQLFRVTRDAHRISLSQATSSLARTQRSRFGVLGMLGAVFSELARGIKAVRI